MDKAQFKILKPSNDEILSLIKKKRAISANEILSGLDNRITLPGLKKRLHLLIEENEISYFRWDKKLKKKYRLSRKEFKEMAGFLQIRPDGRIKKYYAYLPLTSQFNKRLDKVLDKSGKKGNYRKKIYEILKDFKGLEQDSRFKTWRMSNLEKFKTSLKESYIKTTGRKSLRIDKNFLKMTKRGMEIILEGINKVDPEIRINEIRFIRIKGKDYFLAGEEFIPKMKLLNFLNLIEFPPFVKLSFSDLMPKDIEPEEELITLTDKIVKNMRDLFLMIVRDSQVKV